MITLTPDLVNLDTFVIMSSLSLVRVRIFVFLRNKIRTSLNLTMKWEEVTGVRNCIFEN